MGTKWRRWWQTKWTPRLSLEESSQLPEGIIYCSWPWVNVLESLLCPQHSLGLSEVTGMPHASASPHMAVPKQTWTRPPPRTPAKGRRRYRRSSLLETWPWSHLWGCNCSGSQQVQWLSPLCPSQVNHSQYVFLENALTHIFVGSSGWLGFKKKKALHAWQRINGVWTVEQCVLGKRKMQEHFQAGNYATQQRRLVTSQ